MRLFVSEYLCSGACPEDRLDGSLAIEGESMLTAILADFARIENSQVVTTWDERLLHRHGPPSFARYGIETIPISSPAEERRVFRDLSARADATFVIAPEFDGILADRRRLVDNAGGRYLGPSRSAIALCCDKLRLAEHLLEQNLPTIKTATFRSEAPESHFGFPIVVKPRDGAGSQQTYLLSDREDFNRFLQICRAAGGRRQFVQQPFLPGLPVSAAAIVSAESGRVDVFPPAEQFLSDDGRFRYLGGRVPGRCSSASALQRLIHQVCACIPGLDGYVGFDLIVANDNQAAPVLVEINPRLTTSYLGYRVATTGNLAERILYPGECLSEIVWQDGTVEFRPDGAVFKTES